MSARPTGGVNVRGRTITGGVALAAALLLGVALIGGAEDRPADPEPPAPEHLGPLTAIQPQLHRALLTEDEAAHPTPPPTTRTGAVLGAGRPAPAPVAPSGSGPPALAELCRALLEDPSELPGLWSAPPPREVTTRQTPRAGGATLHQMLGVFEAEHAPAAFGRLREIATGCDRLPVRLSDGTRVTMLLQELTAGRPPDPGRLPAARRPESATARGAEAAPGAAEAGYAAAITVESAGTTREGWLSLDRVGPVVSVLRQLGPEAPPGAAAETGRNDQTNRTDQTDQTDRTDHTDRIAGGLAEARRSALGTLRRLLEALPGWRTGAG